MRQNEEQSENQDGGETQPSTTKPARDFTSIIPDISLPNSGGAIRSIGEKFSLNPATGSGNISVPIAMVAGRGAPQLALTYDSGAGNGPFGLGWSLGLPKISRRTEKRLPTYTDEDIFVLSGAEDLVPVKTEKTGALVVTTYQPRTEGAFSRIQRFKLGAKVWWQTITRDNLKRWYGAYPDANGQVIDLNQTLIISDPERPQNIFSWLLAEERDDRGNRTRYSYLADDDINIDLQKSAEQNRASNQAQRYISRIEYGLMPQASIAGDWIFRLDFDYGEVDLAALEIVDPNWAIRPDPISSYRSGFDIRTRRLCRRILQSNLMPDSGLSGHVLNMVTELGYDLDPIASRLLSVTHKRYKLEDGQYSSDVFPSVEFEYTEAKPENKIHIMDPQNVVGSPQGLSENYRFIDLDGEALSGVLSDQAGNWYYRRNQGGGNFDPPEAINRPSGWTSLDQGGQITTLENDGVPYLVNYGSLAGYAERLPDEKSWDDFVAFRKKPNVDLQDPNIRWLDLNGDGKPEICLFYDEVITWYENQGLDGIGAAQNIPIGADARRGPAQVFQNQLESIHTTDMSGDGLSDIVRIRNGDISYWPNLGYGRFGRRVDMASAPVFEPDGSFDTARVRIGDIDGSGVTDILYLSAHDTRYWLNQSGNGWSQPVALQNVPPIDQMSDVGMMDLLGNGTSCLVWSSVAPGEDHAPWRYMQLMTHRDLTHVDVSVLDDSSLTSQEKLDLAALTNTLVKSSDLRADLSELGILDIDLLEKAGAKISEPVKPYLLKRLNNNMGMETRLSYKPSTWFYLQDRKAGRSWVTRLPFPVHLVDRQEIIDFVSNNRYVSRFSFHHGYYDSTEREFRGFARVDQWDMEGTNLSGETLFDRTPVLTRTWFHTGAHLKGEKISQQLAREYYPTDFSLPDSVIEAHSDHTIHDVIEAKRALRGQALRSEIFACYQLEEGQDKPTPKDHPYQVVESRYRIQTQKLAHPISGEPEREHGVYMSVPEETLTQVFDQTPDDPRIAHELSLARDEYGQVTQSATIAYGRKPSFAISPEQEQAHLIISENDLINEPNPDGGWQRLGVPKSAQSWEIGHEIDLYNNGLARPSDISALFKPHGSIETDKYAALAKGKRRLLSAAVQLYRANNDLSLSAQPLDYGQIESMALPCRFYALVYSLQDVAEADGKFTDQDFVDSHYLDPLTDSTHAGLTDFIAHLGTLPTTQGGRAGWWARDNEVELSAVDFYAPIRVRNSWGSESSVEMDPLSLTAIKVTQHMPSGNDLSTISEIDYRLMAPWKVTDANGNMQAARFDTLGRTVQTAIIGKNGEGDQLDELAAFDEASTATSWMEYEFYAGPSQPSYAHSYSRETHLSDLQSGEASRWIEARVYSDGFGREALSKARAANDTDGTVRWLTSAKTIYDNKGNPVLQYEPYFTSTVAYGDGAQTHGVTPILHYDPMDRVIRTDMPDGTITEVQFNPWVQSSYDAMDTFDKAESLFGPDDGPAQYYATPASEHQRTPIIQYLDTLGRPFKTEVTNFTPGGTTEIYTSEVEMDVTGNVLRTIDAKGQIALNECFDRAGRPIKSVSNDAGTSYGLPAMDGQPRIAHLANGHRIEQDYDDLRRPTNLWVTTPGGDNYIREAIVYNEDAPSSLDNGAGQPWRVFDPCGWVETPGYDYKGVPIETTRHVLSQFMSASGPADFTAWDQFDLTSAALPPSESFTTHAVMDALGRPVTATASDGSVQSFGYDEGGGLIKVDLDNQPGANSSRNIVSNIQYDSKGRREQIDYGNGTSTTYNYDANTFRLTALKTARASAVLQHMTYSYDPLGNIIRIDDLAGDAVLPGYQNTPRHRDYIYDSLSRLVEATGREHGAQAGLDLRDRLDNMSLGHANDMSQMGRYTERWGFDEIGNILSWQHVGAAQNWTRDYLYGAAGNNRLTQTTINKAGRLSPTTYDFDDAGNITGYGDMGAPERRVQSSVWNVDDQPETMVIHGNKTAHYRYDASGERMVKRVETSSGYSVRLYLGGFEIFRDFKTNGQFKKRQDTLHVMDGEIRILLVETDKNSDDMADAKPPTERWQFSDHLGTAALELNHSGQVISVEEFHAYGTTAWHWRANNISQKRYRYTGMERDTESGLQYHSARYYVPWLGRWLSTDPLGMVDGPSLWAYVRGNPVGLFDTNGAFSNGPPTSIKFGAEFKVGFNITAAPRGSRKSHYRLYGAFSAYVQGNVGSANMQISGNISSTLINGGLSAPFGERTTRYYGRGLPRREKIIETIISPALTAGFGQTSESVDVNYLHNNATSALKSNIENSLTMSVNWHFDNDKNTANKSFGLVQRTGTFGGRFGDFSLYVLEDFKNILWPFTDGYDRNWTGSGNMSLRTPLGTITAGTDTYTGLSNNKGKTPAELGDDEIGGTLRNGKTFYWANQEQYDAEHNKGYNQSLNVAQTFLQFTDKRGLSVRVTTTGPSSFWSQNAIHNMFNPVFHHFKPADDKNSWQVSFGYEGVFRSETGKPPENPADMFR